MNIDEASQLSLDYRGSQSPSPPPLIVPAGRRYFAGVGAEAGADADAAPSVDAGEQFGHGSPAAAPAEPWRSQENRHVGGSESRDGRLPARAAPLDSRSSAQHRTEHRRQGGSGEECRSKARISDGAYRGSHRSNTGTEPDGRQPSGRSGGGSGGRRQHSPPPRQRADRREDDGRPVDGHHPNGGARQADQAPADGSRRSNRFPEPARRRQRSRSPALPDRHRRSRSPEHSGRRRRSGSGGPASSRHIRSRSPDGSRRRRSRSPGRDCRRRSTSPHRRRHRRSRSPVSARRSGSDGSRRLLEPCKAATATAAKSRREPGNGGPVSHGPSPQPPEQAEFEPGEVPPLPPPPPRERAYDPRLDFFSPQFDALLALYTRGLQLPNPKAVPLDFVMKCRNLLPPTDENWLPPVDKSNPSKTQLHRQEQASRTGNAAAAAAKAATSEAPLDAIAAGIKEGPLTLLKRAYEARSSVRVVTRHARGVRGVATGTLLGFDMHMNLILRDVEETYTVLLRVCRPLPPRGPPTAYTSADAGVAADEGANEDAAPAGDAAAVSTTAGGATAAAEDAASAGVVAASGQSAPPDAERSGAGTAGARLAGASGREAVVLQGGPANGGQRVRWGRKQEVRRRTLKQVFVRGDNIVLVSLAATAGQPGAVVA